METIWTLLFLEGNSFKGRGGEGEVGSAPPPFFRSTARVGIYLKGLCCCWKSLMIKV